MKRWLLIPIVLFAFLVWPGLAQDAPTLASLEISLWPEFDRPEVLVIYQGLFAADTPLPVPVEIHLPASVGSPTAVAYVGEEGQRLNQEHTTRLEGDTLVVSFELATRGFQLEYYDTLPIDAAGQREYAYAYTADYSITALNLEFQVPPTAEDFALAPPADSAVPETDGLVYHLVQAGSVEQGETRNWTFTYQKADSDLTISAFTPAETPAPAAPPAAEGVDNSTMWIFLIAFVALIGVGAGAFWLGRRTQPDPEAALPTTRQRKRRGSGQGRQARRQEPLPSNSTEIMFCHTCGAQLRSDSDFCHRCGTPVRRA